MATTGAFNEHPLLLLYQSTNQKMILLLHHHHPPPPPPLLLPRDSCDSMGSGRPKILLVEDIEINRVVMRRLARELSVELEEAENGQVAVDYFRQGNTCDLVLMDKEMPVMDGHEATRRLRSMGVETPIVALSGNNLPSDRDLFFQAGADQFQTKPLSKRELVRLLDGYQLHHDSSP